MYIWVCLLIILHQKQLLPNVKLVRDSEFNIAVGDVNPCEV